MASEVSLSLSSVMEPIPLSKPSSETSLCDVGYEGEFLGGTTTTAPDTPLSATATATTLFRRASRGSTFRPTRLRTRTEDTVPSKGTSYRRLLSGCSYNSVFPMMSTNSHHSFRAIVGDAQTTPYTMTEDNPFDSSKEITTASVISSLSNDSAHRLQSKTEVASDEKKPPPAEIFVITSRASFKFIDAKEEDWKQQWADETDQTEEETDAPFDEIVEEKNTKRTFSKPPPPPSIPTPRPGTPVQKRPRARNHHSAEKLNSRPIPLQRIKSAPDVSKGGARMGVTNAMGNTARPTTAQQHSPSLHRVNTDTTVTTTTANTANSGRPAMVQRSTTMPTNVPMLGDRPRRKDQKLPASETVFSFGSRVGQSSMMTPTSATTTTGAMSDLSPRIMIPKSQLSRRKKNGVQQDMEFLWKKVASPVRRWAGSDDKVNLRRSKTGCLA